MRTARRLLGEAVGQARPRLGLRTVSVLHAMDAEHTNDEALRYLNRLSDALFVMARYENHERGVSEPLWQPGK